MTAVTATTSSTKKTGAENNNRRIAVIVGVLFFFQLITFLIGSSVQAYLDGDAGRATLTAGVLLELCAGVAVVAIGILMYRVLKTVDKRLAMGYPTMRVLEFTVSAILAIYLLSQLQEFPNHSCGCTSPPVSVG